MSIFRRLFGLPTRRTHHRSQGPVSIRPDVFERVHVWGDQ